MACPRSGAAIDALALLDDPHPEEKVRSVVGRLKKEFDFGLARRLLASARQAGSTGPWFRQQEALCTYKDADLPRGERLDRAMEILSEGEDLLVGTSQEALGLAGAIFKRKWEVDAQKSHLERSLAYYRRGADHGIAGPAPLGGDLDEGYTAINAAFVLDLLADIESREAKKAGLVSDPMAEGRREEARRLREDVLRDLGKHLRRRSRRNWWNTATMAEACMGTGQFDQALKWLQRGRELSTAGEWEIESTVRQLAALARLHLPDAISAEEFEASRAGRMLRTFLGDDHQGVMSGFVGKVGLALSGGGFRASFFHIGVLARLAELDALRHVEVLSCVSGGSIVGADYYLRVRELLERKSDVEVTRQDYLDIVTAMIRDFLGGVQRNVRTRAVLNPFTNFRMSRTAYTRSHRMGELFEREIYSRVPDGSDGRPRFLNELFIKPRGERDDFLPTRHNWRRRAKVPVLILNATSLNTGHNWQFTASWMGEPPAAIEPEIDGVEQLRRMYYCDAPEGHRAMRLGYAVAASACVPGLFAPLTLTNLYPKRVVRLVDGGVHDNQGEVGLLEQECEVSLVSDAGGQLMAARDPKGGLLGVLGRSQGIQNSRIREAQFKDLRARRTSGLLRGFMFVHLKKGLGSPPVDWITPDPSPSPADPSGDEPSPVTSYGINKEVQSFVSGIRTDLDSFSDVEAYALMLSGYRMTTEEFPQVITGIPVSQAPPAAWPFQGALQEAMEAKDPPKDLLRVLKVGRTRAFKIWMLSPALKWVARVLALILLVAAGWALYHWRHVRLIGVDWIGWTLLGVVAGLVLGKTGKSILDWFRRRGAGAAAVAAAPFRNDLARWGQAVGLALFGALASWIHLSYFDHRFLDRERVDRVLGDLRRNDSGSRAARNDKGVPPSVG